MGKRTTLTVLITVLLVGAFISCSQEESGPTKLVVSSRLYSQPGNSNS